MELVLPMYNAHPYFPSKIWMKKYALYTAKYSLSTGQPGTYAHPRSHGGVSSAGTEWSEK